MAFISVYVTIAFGNVVADGDDDDDGSIATPYKIESANPLEVNSAVAQDRAHARSHRKPISEAQIVNRDKKGRANTCICLHAKSILYLYGSC